MCGIQTSVRTKFFQCILPVDGGLDIVQTDLLEERFQDGQVHRDIVGDQNVIALRNLLFFLRFLILCLFAGMLLRRGSHPVRDQIGFGVLHVIKLKRERKTPICQIIN